MRKHLQFKVINTYISITPYRSYLGTIAIMLKDLLISKVNVRRFMEQTYQLNRAFMQNKITLNKASTKKKYINSLTRVT